MKFLMLQRTYYSTWAGPDLLSTLADSRASKYETTFTSVCHPYIHSSKFGYVNGMKL